MQNAVGQYLTLPSVQWYSTVPSNGFYASTTDIGQFPLTMPVPHDSQMGLPDKGGHDAGKIYYKLQWLR